MHTNNGQLYALSYRLRSARDKKRSQKEDFEKRLIQLDQEEDRLRAEKHKLPWVPLSEPYQKGWKRYFILREDVKRSKHDGIKPKYQHPFKNMPLYAILDECAKEKIR